jgi:hypothetical protein
MYKTIDWQIEKINIENSKAFSRIESLYLALNNLEAFERAVLAGGKNCAGNANAAPSLTTGSSPQPC